MMCMAGGYIVLEDGHFCDPGAYRIPLFGGELEDCLSFMRINMARVTVQPAEPFVQP